ncbi:MAG: c-type cytochrome biogenesis protein CcsB [Anaerolineae bacterium]
MINIVLFTLSLAIYLGSTVLYEVHLVLKSRRAGRWATLILVLGALVHASALATRWLESGHPPLANLFESLSLYAWVTVLAYLIVEWRYGYKVLGAFVTPLAFGAIAIASVLPREIRPLIPILRNYWLSVHVTISFVAYSLFTLAFVAAVAYLVAERQLRARRPDPLYYRLPPLEVTEQMGRALAALGLPFMTMALITGSIWAERVWGTPWLWDAKLNMSLVTWFIYVVYFYARNVANWRGRRSAWMLVLGFISIVITYLGVSFFLPTIHGFDSFLMGIGG